MKAKNFRLSLLIFFTFSLSHLLNLSAGVGTTGAQFLKIGPSARALGMAGAYAAISDDVYALWFNPAGLVQLEKNELTATYLKYFADINFGFLGGVAPNAVIDGPLAIGLTYLIVDKMEARGPNEKQTGYNEPERYFNAKDIALTFAYAKKNPFPQLLDGLHLGGNLKLINSEIDQTAAYTLAIDIAAMYSPAAKLNTALVIQNISWGIKFEDETDPLPLNLKFAVAARLKENLTLGFDIDEYLIDQKLYLSLGVEYWVIEKLALRCGYKYGYDTASLGSIVGLSTGLGFRIWGLGVDYAFVPFGTLGDTHRVTLYIKF